MIIISAILWSVMSNNYARIFLGNMGIQWAGWAFATVLKTEKFYDLTGTAGKKLFNSSRG